MNLFERYLTLWVGLCIIAGIVPPVILIPLGYFVFGERVSQRGIAGTVIAFAGVALLLLPK